MAIACCIIMHSIYFFFISHLFEWISEIQASGWDYEKHGPDTWFLNHASCSGLKQSPVNIELSRTLYDQNLRPLYFINYNKNSTWRIYLTDHNS